MRKPLNASEREIGDIRDKPVELISRREPVYPEIAKSSGMTGTVQLVLSVSASGKIDSVTVAKGAPVLAKAAVEAAKEWRYRPAQVNGMPSESEIRTNVVFKLN